MILADFAHAINTTGAISLEWSIAVPLTTSIVCFTVYRIKRKRYRC